MNDRNKTAAGRNAGTAQRQASAMQTQDFFRGVIAEMRRVTWPTRDEWVSATILTVLLVVGIGLFTFCADWVFSQLFSLIHPT